MKRMLICLILMCICFACCAMPDKPQQDTTTVTKTIDKWTDSLSKRDFSKDVESFKDGVKDVAEKTKDAIETHTPSVKKLFKSLGEYLKR